MSPDDQAKPVNPPAGPQVVGTLVKAATGGGWTVGLLVLFAAAVLAAVLFDAPIIDKLSDQTTARGVITWIIAIGTIGIAFVLVYQAFFSVESSDDRFRRGREVFTGLMGILGTIVGFYFGSADRPAVKFEIAPIKVVDTRVFTHVAGGAAPYRYAITSGEKALKHGVTDDGWIVESLGEPPKAGTAINVEVTDSKNQKVSTKLEIPAGTLKSETTPSQPTNPQGAQPGAGTEKKP